MFDMRYDCGLELQQPTSEFHQPTQGKNIKALVVFFRL
jgi:hypothetical protein